MTTNKKGMYLGNTRPLTMTFRNTDNVLADPDAITLYIVDPAGQVSDQYTYADADITRTSTGVYTMDYTPSASGMAGIWQAQWTATTGSSIFTAIVAFYVYEPVVKPV